MRKETLQFNEVSGEGEKLIYFFQKVQSAIEKRVGGLSTIFYLWLSSKNSSIYQRVMPQSTSKNFINRAYCNVY